MRRAAIIVGFVFASVFMSSAALAQLPPDSSLTMGGRVWVTSGYTLHSISRSELRWKGVDSVVPELNVDFVWNRLVFMGSVGGGAINQGVLIDEDFLDRDHQARSSRTRSDVDDDGLFYLNTDVGYRALRWGTPGQLGFVDALAGYQYWHERYVAFGATSGFPGVVAAISSNAKVITQDYYWHSLRLGGRTQVPLFGGLSLKGRAFLVPWSYSIIDDIHHRRGDLRHDPSFHGEASGGLGVQADGGLTYQVWRGLSVEVGYQYWRVKSGEGTETASFTIPRSDPCANHGAATLVAPANNSTGNASAITFQWTAAAGATGYRVFAAIDGGAFANLGTTGDTTLGATLTAGAVEWFVQALFDGCPSLDSAHFTFTIARAQNCPQSGAVPQSPVNATLDHSPVQFDWSAAPNAIGYELWLSLDHGPASLQTRPQGDQLAAAKRK